MQQGILGNVVQLNQVTLRESLWTGSVNLTPTCVTLSYNHIKTLKLSVLWTMYNETQILFPEESTKASFGSRDNVYSFWLFVFPL